MKKLILILFMLIAGFGLQAQNLPSGIYLYKISDNKEMIKSGKIVISK